MLLAKNTVKASSFSIIIMCLTSIDNKGEALKASLSLYAKKDPTDSQCREVTEGACKS